MANQNYQRERSYDQHREQGRSGEREGSQRSGSDWQSSRGDGQGREYDDRNDRQQGGRRDWQGDRYGSAEGGQYQQGNRAEQFGQRGYDDASHGPSQDKLGFDQSRGRQGSYQGGEYRSGYQGGYDQGRGQYGSDWDEGRRNDSYRSGTSGESSSAQGGFGGGMGRSDHQQGAGQSHRGRGPKNYQRSDERICEDVCDRLSDDHELNASDIDVSVSEREVTLSGEVDSKHAKRRAEDCADSCSGVEHVQNNLRVKKSHSENSDQESAKAKNK